MPRVLFTNDQHLELPGARGSTVRVAPGVIAGDLQLTPYEDERYVIRLEDGMLELIFRFRSTDGCSWRHHSIFKSWPLWPGEEVAVSREGQLDEPDFRVETLYDFREDFGLHLAEGGQIQGRFKCTGVSYDGKIKADRLRLRCRFYSTAIADHETVYYELPFSRLLWRKAPLLYVDELIPESGDCVHVEQDPGESPARLPPSPITVVGVRSDPGGHPEEQRPEQTDQGGPSEGKKGFWRRWFRA